VAVPTPLRQQNRSRRILPFEDAPAGSASTIPALLFPDQAMTNVYWGVPGALQAQANPSILVVADSWFWYPLDNLATEIAAAMPSQTLVVIGNNGAEADQWNTKYRKQIEHGFKMYASGVQALMLSGGGNDVAGMSDFLRLLQEDCSGAKTVDDCYGVSQPDQLMSLITGAYRGVITRFRGYNSNAPVLMHNYDHAWPTGKGFFGPGDWLKKPMDFARVPKALRRDLFKDLVARLRRAQLALAKETKLGPLVAISSAGTMPDSPGTAEQWWANELHPTPQGFKLLAKKAFVPALKKIGLAS